MTQSPPRAMVHTSVLPKEVPLVNTSLQCSRRACGGKRTGAKVMAIRAKRFRVKMTFLKRLRQAGAKVARLVKTAAVASLICGSDATGMTSAQLNEARRIARKICSEKTYHRCLDLDLMLEDAGD